MSLRESVLHKYLRKSARCKTTYHSLERLLDLFLNTAFVSLSGLLLGCHSDIVA